MIVTECGEQLLLFTQSDHAALAGALMALWRGDGLLEHPRRVELLLAVREHDNGWREADAAPRIDVTSGRPLAFGEMSPADRIGIWTRGARRFSSDRPFVALLIVRHAIEVHRHRWRSPEWQDLRRRLLELEEELLESVGTSRSSVAQDYRFVELADRLSLGACGAFGPEPSAGRHRGWRYELALGRIALNPFPLAGTTTLEVAFRTLSRTTFESERHLAAELAAATWKRLPVRIERLGN